MLARWRAAGLLIPSLMTLVMLPVLIGLGTWQVNRKAWKEDLIAKLAARPKAEPVSLKEAWEQYLVSLKTNPENAAGAVEYLRVRAQGKFDHTRERHLYSPTEKGLGWEIFTPLLTDNPEVSELYVNRGWVPDNLKDPATRARGQIAGPVEVTGLVRAGARKSWFSAENDTKGNRWYWRDLVGMQNNQIVRSLEVGDNIVMAPFSLDAQAEPANPGGWPKGGATFIQLSNRHLEYAVTWYGTAMTLLGVFIAFARQRLAAIKDNSPLQPE